jgi:hypothetical protein
MNSVLSQVSRESHYRDRNTFVKVYKPYVQPHLEFAAPAWSPWTKADSDVLKKVQKSAVSMVSGLKFKDYRYLERLEELKMPTLHFTKFYPALVPINTALLSELQ